MRVSLAWLREWVEVPEGAEALAERLTMAGLEVEAIEPAAPAFSGVVVAEVLEVAPHPDADRLRVCRVAAGGEPLQVVCGAPNVRPGLRAPLATVGAALPDGTRIRRARLRGVESHGMLCSARELGLADDAEGLWELPPEAPVGEDLHRWLDLDDQVLEVALTPNRADCLSVRGIARETAALHGVALGGPRWEPVAAAREDRLPVAVEAPEACPRYLGRVVRGVDPAARTPLWMAERLRRAGLRSLGPLVDVTNYVLLELGQPLHAFDLARLREGITVRLARAGERIALLDGREVALEPDTLVIADAGGPVALAGIMGGAGSAVGPGTRDVFLECAFFAPGAIAGRARRHGLHTESSHRFERGVDPAMQREALERATGLLLEIAGGEPGPVTEVLSEAHLPRRPAIAFRPQRARRLLGAELADSEMRALLERLGLSCEAPGEGPWRVTPPSWRFDLAIEADLVEEVARLHGYGRLPEAPLAGSPVMPPAPEGLLDEGRIRTLLADRGYHEAVTYSFVPEALQRRLDPEAEPVRLQNPLSAELAVMRTTAWVGLLQALQRNLARQQERVRLFELSMRFVRQGSEITQEKTLAILAAGPAWPEQWGLDSRRPVDFHDVKGDLEALAAATGAPGAFAFEAAAHPALHPGQSARVLRDGEPVGWIGALHPEVAGALDVGVPVVLLEVALEAVRRARVPRFEPLSPFPAVRRDLAVVVDEAVPAARIAETVRAAAGPLLRELRIFDVYTGPGVEAGRKSVSLGLIFQESSRTLTDEEINGVVARVVARLEEAVGATLRQ